MLDGRCDRDLTRARAGDELAFARLYRQHSRRSSIAPRQLLRSRLLLQPG